MVFRGDAASNKLLLISGLKEQNIRYEYKFLSFCCNGKSDMQIDIFKAAFGWKINNLIALTSSIMNDSGREHLSKEKQSQLSNELCRKILGDIKSKEARWIKTGRNIKHGWKSMLNRRMPKNKQRRSLLAIIEEQARNYLDAYRANGKLSLDFNHKNLFGNY